MSLFKPFPPVTSACFGDDNPLCDPICELVIGAIYFFGLSSTILLCVKCL